MEVPGAGEELLRANHIPVQMADEEAPHFWRLRETQALVEWLRAHETKLVDTGAIGRWLDLQSAGPWWSLLREAVAGYEIETGAAELPIATSSSGSPNGGARCAAGSQD